MLDTDKRKNFVLPILLFFSILRILQLPIYFSFFLDICRDFGVYSLSSLTVLLLSFLLLLFFFLPLTTPPIVSSFSFPFCSVPSDFPRAFYYYDCPLLLPLPPIPISLPPTQLCPCLRLLFPLQGGEMWFFCRKNLITVSDFNFYHFICHYDIITSLNETPCRTVQFWWVGSSESPPSPPLAPLVSCHFWRSAIKKEEEEGKKRGSNFLSLSPPPPPLFVLREQQLQKFLGK